MIDKIPEMASLKDASRQTGLSYNALRNMCNKDAVPHIRVGTGRNASIKINMTALSRILNGEEVIQNET